MNVLGLISGNPKPGPLASIFPADSCAFKHNPLARFRHGKVL